MKIAIIPARGGSKRIPRKNIKEFAGKPMIAHSIIAAQKSGLFDHILVSSEDDEILALAERYGATPLRRPSELADDMTATIPVIRHAVLWAEKQNWSLEAACCIYATAPFLRATDLIEGWRLLGANNSTFAFSATTFAFPVFRGMLREGGGVRMIFPEHFSTRSQDLPEALHDAGQFYWGTPQAWKHEDRFFTKSATPVMLPRHRVQDIDTIEDWKRAELMWSALGNQEAEAAQS